MYLMGLPELLEEGTVSGVAGMSVIGLLLERHRSWYRAPTRCRGIERCAYAREIFGGIDANRIVPRFDHLDTNAVFERTELFERFRALHGRLRQTGQTQEAVPAVDVEPHMPPRRGRGRSIANVGDW